MPGVVVQIFIKQYQFHWNHLKIRLLPLCLAALFLHTTINASPSILILQSYHKSDWTDDVLDGITAGLVSYPEKEIYIDYMDAKKDDSPEYLSTLYQLYERKYSKTSFDLIITVDNNAFDFVKRHNTVLFKNRPIVFCGVNGFTDSMIDKKSDITGVVENSDFEKNIAFSLQMRKSDTIYFICDKTETGQINKKQFLQTINKNYTGITAIPLEDLSYNQLDSALRNIPKTTFVFFISFWQDKNQATILPQKLETAFRHSNAPIFGRSEWMIERGMVGGLCVTGYHQGFTAASLATQILRGTRASQIPIIKDSPNKFIFDYDELKHHGIPIGEIPEESIVVNKPNPIKISLAIAILLIIICILCIAGLILLIIYIKMRNSSIRKISENEEKYRELIEGADVLVTKIKPEGTILFVNQRSEKFWGKTPEKCVGNSIFDFIHPDDITATRNLLSSWINDPSTQITLENRQLHGNGQIYHFLWTITKYFDAQHTITFFNTIGRDITHYKQIQNQLQHAQKLDAIGTLAGGIAHDFNNLLTGILGFTEVALIDLKESDPAYPSILEVRKISMRARELVRQILTFSRQTPFELLPIRIKPVVQEVISLLRASIPENIVIKADIHKIESLIYAEQTRIHQIVMNLSTNAYHSMEEKGGTLTIHVSETFLKTDNNENIPSGKYILLKVQDTGTGIGKEHQKHLFEPFFTTKSVNKGTGLGLSVVHGIVSDLKGFIRFSSEAGVGSSFDVYIPCIESLSGLPLVKDTDESQRGTGTIVIVDDEEIVARSMCEILKRYGYTPHFFTSSKQALEVLLNNTIKVDLVITDLTMPEMSGETLIRKLNNNFPKLPIILCTGFYDKNSHVFEKDLKICNFFLKPIETDVLLKAIQKALKNI
jgi:PAS domain S-box-containing protein